MTENEKPNIEDVLYILKWKQNITGLYEQIDKQTKKLFDQFGEGRFDYNLNEVVFMSESMTEFQNQLLEQGQYLKFELVDNIQKLVDDQQLFTSTSVKPLAFSSRVLKRCPESLKPQE